MSFQAIPVIDAALSYAALFLPMGEATLTPPDALVGGVDGLVLDEAASPGDNRVVVTKPGGDASGAVVPRGSKVVISGGDYSVKSAQHKFGKLELDLAPPLATASPQGLSVDISETPAVVVNRAGVVSIEQVPQSLVDQGVEFGFQAARALVATLPEAGWGASFTDPRGEVWRGSIIKVDPTESVVLVWVGGSV